MIMKIIITEEQLRKIISEDYVVDDDPSTPEDVEKSFVDKGHYKWFDQRSDELKNYPESMIMDSLKTTLGYLRRVFNYNLKRVFVKDGGEIVAFLIFSDTNEKKERISDKDGNRLNVILATAVDPEYRNRGLLRKMIMRANLGFPYLVHTSHISPHHVWEKLGCTPVVDMGQGNKVEKCG